MSSGQNPRRKHPHSRSDISESEVLPNEDQEVVPATQFLIDEIKAEADKLAENQTTRGDLKILARALKELRYAFSVFKPYRMQRKVTVFGSARTPLDDPIYTLAEDFGRGMAENEWMVLTGAGGGIMEAAHVGSGQKMAMGVNIMLPFEQDANHIIRDDPDKKLVHLKYFFTRKLLFVKEVHAIALFPGGFGTLDEAFETFTLVQTGKRDPMPIVCLDVPGGTYWTRLVEVIERELLDPGWISPEDLSLFKVTDNVDDAIDEIFGFYAVYHSMRYVRGKLVLRLLVEPSDEFIDQLNDKFGDIAADRIERVTAHPVEADDEHLRNLPRLSFTFDRKLLGRLRQMIDFINTELNAGEQINVEK